jgi:hypothetical protein
MKEIITQVLSGHTGKYLKKKDLEGVVTELIKALNEEYFVEEETVERLDNGVCPDHGAACKQECVDEEVEEEPEAEELKTEAKVVEHRDKKVVIAQPEKPKPKSNKPKKQVKAVISVPTAPIVNGKIQKDDTFPAIQVTNR